MNKLESILEIKNRKRTALLIDAHNLIFRCVFVANKNDPLDEEFLYWKFLVINNILTNIKKYDADLCVLAFDGKNYWRKQIYSEYKGQRKSGRDASPVNFEKFFPVMDKFFNDMKKAFKNIMYFKTEQVEADDIIAVLTKYKLKDYDRIINISNDSDMCQLMKYKNYKQFDPIKKKFIEQINPEKQLMIKILTGDRSDNIPGVKAKCGPVTAKKMLDLGLENSLLDEQIKMNFDRNKQLIDFECIPVSISLDIQNKFDEYVLESFNGRKTFSFFTKHGLAGLTERIQEFAPSLKKLI